MAWERSGISLEPLSSWKVFPVSKKVHTTRCQALGVITEKETQVVGTHRSSAKGSETKQLAFGKKCLVVVVAPAFNPSSWEAEEADL